MYEFSHRRSARYPESMATIKTQTILIKNDKNISSEGTLRFTIYDHQDRVKRAIIALAGFWLLALISVPVVVLHFVLVPAFLFMGPYFAYKRYHTISVPTEVIGHCPTCDEELTIQVETSDRLPMWSYCSARHDPIQFVEIAGT